MEVALRVATATDAAAVLALWREADAEPSHTDDVGSVSRLIQRDPGALIVAEEGRRIVGSIIAGWDGWRGSIYRLAVTPAHRRRGLGGRLVVAAERRLADAGAARLQGSLWRRRRRQPRSGRRWAGSARLSVSASSKAASRCEQALADGAGRRDGIVTQRGHGSGDRVGLVS